MFFALTIPKIISIHAPRTGSDQSASTFQSVQPYFNPRSPHGERPSRKWSYGKPVNFNPRSPHGERRWQTCRRGRLRNFNPRSPHGERRDGRAAERTGVRFQSTLPARGATIFIVSFLRLLIYFNPRSPHGERPFAQRLQGSLGDFNPRSPHGERPRSRPSARSASHFNPRSPHGERLFAPAVQDATERFQSTLPARGATAGR